MNSELERAIRESNRIEGVPNEGLYLKNHLLAARVAEISAEERELLHPRVYHAILFQGIPLPLNSTPGNYRVSQVRVGYYLPPPGDQVLNYMTFWWDLSLEDDPWSSHAHFEAIHPFIDGNGRVGRLVYWNRLMLDKKPIDIIYAADRLVYYSRLERWREEQEFGQE